MAGPEPRTEELNNSIPPGWILSGFSSPKPEGDTHYRVPTAPQTVLTFPTPAMQYVQYRYQIHSPDTPVTGRVSLNGRLLDTFTFPRGQYATREVGAFSQAGLNRLTVEYLCGSKPCDGMFIQQFWTRLSLAPPLRTEARVDVGLGVERWWLDAPRSPLTIQGTTPLLSESTAYYRNIESDAFTLGWPEGTRVVNAAFQISAVEPFRMTTRIDGHVVSTVKGVAIENGNKVMWAGPTFSLVRYPYARGLSVKIDCLSGAKGCANLYFTRVAVMSAPPVGPSVAVWSTLGVGLVLMLSALWWLLKLPPLSRRRAA